MIIIKMSVTMMIKGAATNTDGNDGNNEVKLRAEEDALRGGCKQQNSKSSKQDAAVQRNHRVEGFLCVSEITHTGTHTTEQNTRTHQHKRINCRVANLLDFTITLQ